LGEFDDSDENQAEQGDDEKRDHRAWDETRAKEDPGLAQREGVPVVPLHRR